MLVTISDGIVSLIFIMGRLHPVCRGVVEPATVFPESACAIVGIVETQCPLFVPYGIQNIPCIVFDLIDFGSLVHLAVVDYL